MFRLKSSPRSAAGSYIQYCARFQRGRFESRRIASHRLGDKINSYLEKRTNQTCPKSLPKVNVESVKLWRKDTAIDKIQVIWFHSKDKGPARIIVKRSVCVLGKFPGKPKSVCVPVENREQRLPGLSRRPFHWTK